jgi:hypothetical protein
MDIRLVFGVGISMLFAFLRYRFPVMPRYISNIGILVGVALIAWAAILWCIPDVSPLAKNTFPGFSSTFGLEIYDAAVARRQYLFDYVTPENAQVSLYASPGGSFDFSAVATNNEIYTMRIPVGSGGIPIYQFIFLTCEVGVSENSTYMRVLVDGREIKHESYPFRIDLGSHSWSKGTIGADLEGKNNSAFKILDASVGHVTMPDDKLLSDLATFRKFFKDMNVNVKSN